MTSPANNPQIPIPATITSATAVTSYASAAGAPGNSNKSSSAPVVATGSRAPAAVSAPAVQNAKLSSPTPLNGKSVVAPAVPAVARGSSTNGFSADHSRKSSFTMAANGPNSYAAHGAPKPGIQFGFDSPAMAHSTPQVGSVAPIPIPGMGNHHVPSPAHSPSPIPQPSASGGRPPSGLQQPSGQMTFGSLSSDGERHMRHGSVPPNPNAMGSQSGLHYRRESNHSVQADNRISYPPQGGRGRGFNPHNAQYNNQLGYPPNNQFRNGPGQGRGMPPSFQPQARNMQYPNSPQPTRSPALVPSIPNTPNMPPATMQANMPMQTTPQYHYAPPVAAQHQQYGYPPQQIDQYGRAISMPYGYNGVPSYIGPPQVNSPGYNQQFAVPFHPHPQSHSMSRSPSQPERPASASQPNQPLVVGSSQPTNATSKPAPTNFVKPRRSAAIQIKTADGDIVDTSSFKQPASPAPAGQPSKTPPVVASTPTPPPKSSTPSHVRSESTVTPKTAKEVQDELKEKIKLATLRDSVASEAVKTKELVTPKDKPVVADEAVNKEPLVTAAADEVGLPKEVTKSSAPEPTKGASNQEEASTQEASTQGASTQGDSEEVAKADVAEQVEKVTKPADPAAQKTSDEEEDEIERMIREMEEADAKREKEEEEHRRRTEAEKAERKKKEEEEKKTTAADQDRQLREQEREMERLEEEKERRQKEAESSGKTMSVAEALAAARTGKGGEGEGVTATATATATAESVADKLSGLKIGDDKGASDNMISQRRMSKPAALNLAPLDTKPIEAPQPSAALQSLKSARFLQVMDQDIYPTGISSPNPALNAAVTKKGKSFKYDSAFLLQFQKVFTEQPSLEFHQQVKSLIGDGTGSARAQTPRQPSNRGSAAFSMGTFNAPPGRTLPPGTSSEQRLAMSTGAMPRPPVGSIGSFRGPSVAFPGATMSRTSSQSRAGAPNSPSGRQSSRSTRGSRREFNAKDAQAAKTMPLTAGQDIKPIAVTSTGWKPSSVGAKAGASATPSGFLDPEMVQRKVKAALNKMTPEKFDRIADQILAIAGQSKDESDGRTLRQVIQLTFEKATDEAHWASMYARFCKRMLENMSADVRDERIKDKNGNVVSGGNLFRKYLLNRCQEEFERGWTTNLPDKPAEDEGADDASKKEKALGDAAMLSDEYYELAAAKRRGLGLVQFIGELYKLGMLTERIMHECVHKLVDYKGVPDEAEIESLSKLLRTIGANLDATEKGRPMMDVYFQRIQTMVNLPELQSRMKFMLMDVLDLRRGNWVSKEANKGPKTLEEVRVEAEATAAAKAQESARHNARGAGGRPVMGRGDARNFSGGYPQQTSNQVGMDDLRRLKGSASRTSSQSVMLGPTSMFSSRSNSGRRLGPGGSLGRPGEESGASSRTGTPPTGGNNNTNAFSLLATMETENPASPPSAGPSPSLTKAALDGDKKGE